MGSQGPSLPLLCCSFLGRQSPWHPKEKLPEAGEGPEAELGLAFCLGDGMWCLKGCHGDGAAHSETAGRAMSGEGETYAWDILIRVSVSDALFRNTPKETVPPSDAACGTSSCVLGVSAHEAAWLRPCRRIHWEMPSCEAALAFGDRTAALFGPETSRCTSSGMLLGSQPLLAEPWIQALLAGPGVGSCCVASLCSCLGNLSELTLTLTPTPTTNPSLTRCPADGHR